MQPVRFHYVIGDIQGCATEFFALLAKIEFDPNLDQLWIAGDMINRGPGNLVVLRYLKSLGERAVCVLGNHDFFFLAVVAGVLELGADDTLHDLMTAPDRDELVNWLRQCPLFHVEGEHAMVHAGLLPQWSVEQAKELSLEVQKELRSGNWKAFLRRVWGRGPCVWKDELSGSDRLRMIVNVMCRLRFLRQDGSIDLKPKGPPEDFPGLVPWYEFPGARWRSRRLYHGHWSAQGFRETDSVVSLDSGCVWGGSLSLVCIEDNRVWQQFLLSSKSKTKED